MSCEENYLGPYDPDWYDIGIMICGFSATFGFWLCYAIVLAEGL
jgi:hypothetical protein